MDKLKEKWSNFKDCVERKWHKFKDWFFYTIWKI